MDGNGKRSIDDLELENEIPKKKRTARHNICHHCGNNSTEDYYFSIPNGITRTDHRAKWLSFLQLKDVPARACICSKHFREEDIKFSVGERRKVVKRDAVPSIEVPKCEARKRKDGQYRCFYCGKSDGGFKCYFLFPEDPNLHQKWVDFCNCAPELILPNNRLCSDHFEKNLIIGSMERSQRRHLREDAVPTIKLPTSCAENQDISTPDSCELDTLLSCELTYEENTMSLSSSSTPIDDSPMLLSSDEDDVVIRLDTGNLCSDTENVRSDTENVHSDTENVHSDTENVHSDTENVRPCTPTTPSTRARRLFDDTPAGIPKYLGQIRTPHLSTPRRAKACFYKCRRLVYEKDEQIRALNKKLQRAKQKIQNLTDLVKHLRKINKISEQARIKLMVC